MVTLGFLKRAFMALSGFCRVGQRHLVFADVGNWMNSANKILNTHQEFPEIFPE